MVRRGAGKIEGRKIIGIGDEMKGKEKGQKRWEEWKGEGWGRWKEKKEKGAKMEIMGRRWGWEDGMEVKRAWPRERVVHYRAS
jgi:hypothetical protein